MNQLPSAAKNIIKRIERLLAFSLVLIIFSTLIIAVSAMLTHQKLKSYFTKQQEIQTFLRSRENTNELLNFVEANKEIISQIEIVFPDETNIDVAYQAILKISQEFDSKAELKLKASVPGTFNQKSVLPMELILSVNSSGANQLLRRIERLPYIIEVVAIELNNPLGQDSQATITFRLYVDHEFIKT
jgi:hypothetical protein